MQTHSANTHSEINYDKIDPVEAIKNQDLFEVLAGSLTKVPP